MIDTSSGIGKYAVKLTPFDFTQELMSGAADDDVLKPIYATGGLILPITPTVTESLQANYDAQEIPQNNEAFHVYKGSSNRQIGLGNVIFPADTEEAGRYALAAIHFFRTYSMSDFGVGRTGRPPSPMWFSGFGKYIYHKVPTLLTTSTITLGGADIDLLPVPSPGGTANQNNTATDVADKWSQTAQSTARYSANLDTERQLEAQKNSVDLNWLPAKVEITGVNLIVQHSPIFWKTFNLADYRKGKMVEDTSGW